jgi:hypothetical protein
MAATAAGGLFARSAAADTPLKIGISIPLTGAGFSAVGRQLQGARSSSSSATMAAPPTMRAGLSRK